MSDKYYPLGETQKIMLWSQLVPGRRTEVNEFNSIRCYFGLTEPGNIDMLEQAWFMLLEHNDSLRLKLVVHRFGVRNYVSSLDYTPLERVTLDDNIDDVKTLLGNVDLPVPAPFNAQLSVAKLCIWRGKSYLLMCFNHLCIDGYGLGLVFERLGAYYNYLANGTPLPVSMKRDYSFIEQMTKEDDYRGSALQKEDEAYWINMFKSQSSYRIPSGRWNHNYKAEHALHTLSKEQTLRLEELCCDIGCSLSSVVMHLIALDTWLSSDKSCFGIYTANHGRITLPQKRTIGCMYNFVPTYFDIVEQKTVNNFLRDGYMAFLDNMKHARFIMNNQKKAVLLADRHLNHNNKRDGRLLDNLWLIFSPMDGISLLSGNSKFEHGLLSSHYIPYGLFSTLNRDAQNRLVIGLMYQTSKYTPERIGELFDSFSLITDLVLEKPDRTLAELKRSFSKSASTKL